MSFYFLINNLHFALELMGAVVLLMAAWLTLDTYYLRKDFPTLARAIGLGLFAAWETIYALGSGNDIILYFGFFLFLAGLILLVTSFLKQQPLQVQAVIIIPAFTLFAAYLHAAAAILLFAIAYLSYRRFQQEFNKTWIPFSLSFALLGVASFLAVFDGGNQTGIIAIVGYFFKFASFVLLARWVWQFLQLRIRESLILICISAALFLSTLVTLAFSTILISQITAQTEANLLTDARVLDLHISGLKEESLAKAALVASDDALAEATASNDFVRLEQLSEVFLETYKLGFLTVVDDEGSVLVRAHALSRRKDTLLGERALEEALRGEVFVTVESSPVEKLSIRAGAPLVKDKKIVGAVIAGYPLDNALMDGIKRVTGLEMFIYEKNTSVAATALARDGRTRLTGVMIGDIKVEKAVLTGGKTMTAQVEFYGRPFLASYLPLVNGDGKIIGMISAGKPQQDILDIANSTNRLTLITVIFIMLALAYPMYIFTRRLTDEV